MMEARRATGVHVDPQRDCPCSTLQETFGLDATDVPRDSSSTSPASSSGAGCGAGYFRTVSLGSGDDGRGSVNAKIVDYAMGSCRAGLIQHAEAGLFVCNPRRRDRERSQV